MPGGAVCLPRQVRGPHAESQPCTLGLQPLRCCSGVQRAEVGAWNQQVRTALAAEQAVLQHPQKNMPAGRASRQIQRGDAQGVDKILHQAGWQTVAYTCHGGIGCALKLLALPALGGAQQRQFFTPAPAPGAGQCR